MKQAMIPRVPALVSPRSMAGVGLVEVLVAMVVLAFGLLGVAALQATALRNSQSSLEHSRAVIQTYAMFDRMRANADQARLGAYDLVNLTCDVPDAGTLPQNERREWIQALKADLGPNACGQILCNNPARCTIVVQWDDARGTQQQGDAGQPQRITTETLL
jgi:type IV pilus assembly protein PilV